MCLMWAVWHHRVFAPDRNSHGTGQNNGKILFAHGPDYGEKLSYSLAHGPSPITTISHRHSSRYSYLSKI
jgi:hypothetical protein